MPDTLAVIVPVFNEEKHLPHLVEEMVPALDNIIGQGNWMFIFVDNGSTDGSPAILADTVAAHPGRVITLDRPNYGSALRAGILNAEANHAYIINVDFWDKEFLNWSWINRAQYDLILGSKRADPTLNHLAPYRKFLSWGLNTLLQLHFGFIGRDTHGQKALNLSSVRAHVEQCVMQRGQFDTELVLRVLRAGLWVAEVPVPITEKRRARNLMLRKIYNNVVDVLKLRSVMNQVPWTHKVRYHRWAREDVEQARAITWHTQDNG